MIRKVMQSAYIVTGILGFEVGAANAARPLYVDDAAPVDVGSYQLEVGLGHWDHPTSRHWDFPLSFRSGLVPRMDVGVGVGGQFEEQTEPRGETHIEGGLGDLTVSAKWNILADGGDWLPAMALAPTVKFPTADRDKRLGSGEIDYDLTLIASKSLAPGIGVHMNVGYLWLGESDGENFFDIVHYGLALEYRLLECLNWVGEVFAEQEVQRRSSTVVQFSTGLRASVADDLTFDLAVGLTIHGDAPDFTATTGLTWVIDFKEVRNAR